MAVESIFTYADDLMIPWQFPLQSHGRFLSYEPANKKNRSNAKVASVVVVDSSRPSWP